MASSSTDSPPLPSFEDWIDAKLRTREDYTVLRMNVLYYASFANLSFARVSLIDIADRHSGMAPAESPEFRAAQKEWWYYYRKVTILRSFILQFFDIPPPNWAEDIVPERMYCKVLLSEEDFKKFVTAEGSGMHLLKPEGEKEYADKLRNERSNARTGPVAKENLPPDSEDIEPEYAGATV